MEVTYFDFPFFELHVGDILGVMEEHGHPREHKGLPVCIDDEEEDLRQGGGDSEPDCLLLCRNGQGRVGWALASFLEVVGTGVGEVP